MLYFTRKIEESIIINNDIEIKIIEARRNSVKIGVTQRGCGWTVMRKEIHDHVAEENNNASTTVFTLSNGSDGVTDEC